MNDERQHRVAPGRRGPALHGGEALTQALDTLANIGETKLGGVVLMTKLGGAFLVASSPDSPATTARSMKYNVNDSPFAVAMCT